MSTELSTGKNITLPRAKRANEVVGALFAIMFLAIVFLPFKSYASIVASFDGTSIDSSYVGGDVLLFPTDSLHTFNGGTITSIRLDMLCRGNCASSGADQTFQIYDSSTPMDCQSITQPANAWGFTGDYGQHFAVDIAMSGSACTLPSSTSGHSYYLKATSWFSGYLAHWSYNSGYPFYLISGGTTAPPDYRTRITDLQPSNASTTGNSVAFHMGAYINADDLGSIFKLRITLHNIDQNVLLLSAFSPSDIVLYDADATTSGDFSFSTTTIIGDGNYRLEATLQNTNNVVNYLTGGISGYFGVIDRKSTQFTVNEGTFIGLISQQSYGAMGAIFASTTATSTAVLAQSCYPFSGQFDTNKCLAFMFIPDAGMVQDTLTNFKDNVALHFPLGYITDFITIMSTSTIGSLPEINLILPSALGLGTPSLHLALTGVLDPILNSTMGNFSTSTETFYEITSYYWDIVIYVLLFFYLVSRILGSWLVPSIDLGSFNLRNL